MISSQDVKIFEIRSYKKFFFKLYLWLSGKSDMTHANNIYILLFFVPVNVFQKFHIYEEQVII